MTKQESFKRRIRERMATTGERYAEARRILTEQSAARGSTRLWVSDPEMSDDSIRTIDGGALRRMLLDDDERAHLFPDVPTELRSKPTAKVQRMSIGPGVALIALEDRGGGRTKVVVAHERLPAVGDVEEWKFFWSEWLDAIDEAGI